MYTDPYGTAYGMAATGELRSITDRQGNTLTFQPNGIISSTRQERRVRARRAGADHQGRRRRRSSGSGSIGRPTTCTRTTPNGDLTTVDAAARPRLGSAIVHYTYDAAPPDRRPSTRAATPRARRRTTRTGGLQTDTDAIGQRHQLHVRPGDAHDHDDTYPGHGRRDADVRRAGAAAQRDRSARPHDHARVRREPERDEADERARRGDDRDIRRARQPDVGHRPARDDAHDYNDQNLPVTFTDRLGHVDDDRLRRPRRADALRATSSERGSRSRLRAGPAADRRRRRRQARLPRPTTPPAT